MKQFALLLLLLLIPPAIYAQTHIAKINIPMQQGKINYEQTVIAKAATRDKAIQWLIKQFPNNKMALLGKKTGIISGEGLLKVSVNPNGNYYWLKFKVDILLTDATYTINIYDFYEKPIEKGISNEYSKISYRWWDYRRGHPWSGEDGPLFLGLDKNSRELLASFKTAMEQ